MSELIAEEASEEVSSHLDYISAQCASKQVFNHASHCEFSALLSRLLCQAAQG